MRKLSITFFTLPIALFTLSCNPPAEVPKDFRSEVQTIYQGLIEKYGPYDPANPESSTWTYSYHPMIQAAWIYKGKLPVESAYENRLKEGNEIFWTLNDEITRQSRAGATSLDKEAFLALIEDEDSGNLTRSLIDSGVPALNAFVIAFLHPTNGIPEIEDAQWTEMILRTLGRLYTDHPEICDFPVGQSVTNDDSNNRDWLQTALAANGMISAQGIIDWDNQIEDLQDLVPDQPFWDGRLTHAYVLRSIQMTGKPVIDPIIEQLASCRQSGAVTGFARWMYWNISYMAYADVGIIPLEDADRDKISDFLMAGLKEGPMGEGEETLVIADSIGRAPSVGFADSLIAMVQGPSLDCARRQLGYRALGKMLIVPIDQWMKNNEDAMRLKTEFIALLERGGLECGNVQLLELYSGVLNAYSAEYTPIPDVKLTDHEMSRVNAAFMSLLPNLSTTDERFIAIDLLLWGINQPEFMMAHPEFSRYRSDLLVIYNDWKAFAESESYDSTNVPEDTFINALERFRQTLGSDSLWED